LNNKEIYGRKININWCSGKDFQVREENQHFDIKEEANEDELENYGQNAKMFEDNQSDEALTSDDSSSEGEDDDEDDEDDKEEGDDEENGDEDNEAEGSDNDMEVDDEEEEITKADEPDTTLFIRNILFETTEQDLFDHFSDFGPVKYARIVMDQTGRSRGTGFVKFYKTRDAKKVLEEAKAAKATMPGTAPTTKSVLKPELPQSQSSMLMLQDRLLDVILAVDKEEATKLTAPNKKKDKKNLYLLKEGVVFPKTPEAKGLPEIEITKRLQSHDLRKRQLEKNPSLFISKTRLAIRNMPYDWTDKELRTLAREAVPNFKREAKEGKREDLTKQEKAEGWDQKPKLKQVKVEVDKSQVSATTNKPKSKGFGFVEFEHHSHALATLRYLNCNPGVQGLNKDAKEAKKSQESKGRNNRRLLLVEFSVENKLVLKKRDDRKRVSFIQD
jgi:nucleolar protein 4